jgi:hypothetical protein
LLWEAVDKRDGSTALAENTLNTWLDVGDDTRTGVNDLDYQVPFPFNGKFDKLTFNLGPEQLAEADRKKIQEAVARARD